jgi:hypothetical protein
MGKENQRRLSSAHQRQASFVASRGWKSSNSSPLPVKGELFPLTFPFYRTGDFTILRFLFAETGHLSTIEMLQQRLMAHEEIDP